MTESHWNDDRLRAAYADRFASPAPEGFSELVIARARATPTRGRSMVPAWVGVIAAVLVVALGGGVLLWARSAAPGPSPSGTGITASPDPSRVDGFPAEILGLPVISVSEAIARREAGPEDTELAVRGWMSNPPPISCPAQLEPPGPVELVCPDAIVSWLTEREEATWEVTPDGFRGRPASGPALQPIFDVAAPRATSDGSGRSGLDPTPFRVVLVGHFDDHRSVLCQDADACRRNFIVDARVWVEGAEAGREVVKLTEPAATTRLTADEAVAAVARVRTPEVAPWVAVVERAVSPRVDPRISKTRGLADAAAVWVVRQLEADAARSVAHTYFVDDTTGDVFRSTRANVILALSAGERVVELDEGVRVTITDRTGTIDGVRPIGDEERPAGARLVPGGDHPPVYLWQPESEPRAIAIEWVGSPCDTHWSLVVRNTTPTIELDHPAIGACPAIPIRRRVILVFGLPVDVTEVQVAQLSPYAVD
jgi:hypothetical protein